MSFRPINFALIFCASTACSDHNRETHVDNPTEADSEQEQPIEIQSTLDENTDFGIKVPADLQACFVELDKMLPDSFKNELKRSQEGETIRYHMSLGMWMRNNWGLWGDSDLAKWFHNREVHHPDDMSGIILDSYWRQFNGKPIEFEAQVKYYKDYWVKRQQQTLEVDTKSFTTPDHLYTAPEITLPDAPVFEGKVQD